MVKVQRKVEGPVHVSLGLLGLSITTTRGRSLLPVSPLRGVNRNLLVDDKERLQGT